MTLKIVYAGTPEFAVPALDALVHAGHQVLCVYTQPDRPAGRGRALMPSAVKSRALQHGLPVEQPEHFREPSTVEKLRDLQPDVMVVAAYGLLLPPSVLEIPRIGCLNIHGSLLPRWRGAAPIQRAILAGDLRTGVAIMHMEAGLDTGPVYHTATCEIGSDDTTATLTASLAELGARTLVDVLPAIAAGQLSAVPQPEDGVMYAKKVAKAEALIDWRDPADQIERKIRAFKPWPVAETRWRDAQLRIHAAEVLAKPAPGLPGAIVAADATGLEVATGHGVLRLTQLQMAGRTVVSAAQFIQGESQRASLVGHRLGDL